ncbi:MAG: PAS domain S-box protein, partial [Candidatus Riflebacteria bacterium]|nr:PAS domain S-box protein [Candidatus Riflebacteria bacterium]
MEIFLKPLTEASSYIFLSGIFMIILGALIGITPPDSRKTLHTSLAIPLFISVGLVYIFRSFDFLVEIGGFIKINSCLQCLIIFCGVELGRRNIESAYGKKPFSPLWYILFLLFYYYLACEFNYINRVIIAVMIMLGKLFAVIVTIKAAKILSDYNRNAIRGAFSVAFFGAIIQLLNDLPFAQLVDGHYKPLEPSAINIYYLESVLFFIISIFILFRRYAYEKSQRLHRLNTLSLISPVVVYVTSIIIALLVLIGSNLITREERVKQNYESQSYNFNIKNAIKQRIDLAISSARLFSQSPNLSKYLSKPDNDETREEVKKYLVSLNDKNPGISVFLSDSKGNILVSSEIDPVHEGQVISSRESFINGSNGITSLSIYREKTEDKFGFYVDYPVLSADEQQVLGVFIFKIELDDLENLIRLNHYPTMIVDLKDNGRIMVANDKIFIDQNCGDIKQYVDQGTQPIDNIPILSMMTKHSAFFSLASFGDYHYGVLSLSNVDQSATTQVWLLFIALLVTFILYLILYGIAYNSENMKTIESAQSNFQLIFNHTPDPICVISEETTEILAVNKSMQKCFGYEESLVGKKLDDLIVDTSKLEYHTSLSDEVSVSECRFKKSSGDIFTAETTASNIDYASKKAVLLNIHDISIFKVIEEKLTEAKNSAEEANQIKSRLLANASHELRTPMTAIIGLTELAVSICNDDNQKQIIELLRISSKSLMSLINDMFNLTEVQNGKVIIKNSAFKLNSLLDEVKEYVSFLAKRDKKDIVFRNLTTLPDIVIADLDHIRQSLLAVIDYISDICVNNNTLVNIDFNEVSKSSGQLIVIISGIDEDKREEIEKSIDNDIDYADPYHASVTRKFASGISLHSMILRTMNGYIQIDRQSVI